MKRLLLPLLEATDLQVRVNANVDLELFKLYSHANDYC